MRFIKFLSLTVLLMGLFSVNVNAEIVKILVMGDTQKVTDTRPQIFLDTMDRILTDPGTSDADFILQMGDVSEDDFDHCWDTAQEGWRKLDGIMPYVLNIGNNDGSGNKFIEHFPKSYYDQSSSYPMFANAYVGEYDSFRNFAFHFEDQVSSHCRYEII